MIISGGEGDSVGTSVEVYVPSTGQHCNLTNMPDRRFAHTMEAKTVCGGGYPVNAVLTSCLSLSADGTWKRTTELLEER